ncbi:winged helix-turn-helix domain-containing protein [Bradyrhizobium sp. WSM 1738]|uniref:ATP-binding protein n=1 Tax=Bradyrhizobium hereditatis TaxID=2821405 RepID=UPI001CE36763|nr:winged helix-turn-helix domain-containing protein [Bradyrhizobium hereditatis]MCA6117351.1 winged helix-turn-helix domain-containing protein [Bradyrhizobium hereditatis]
MAPSRGDRDHSSASVTESDGRNHVSGVTFAFGPFRLSPRQQLLLQGDNPVPLGSRAFEILVALVERAGEVVDKDELIARVWSGLTVEESNLRAQINAVRRALAEGGTGENYIVTVPGRGYRFVAAVARSTSDAAQPFTAAGPKGHNFPDRLTRPIGRDDIVAMVSSRLPRGRFVTIVGPGGIGKTTVALAVADRLITAYKDGGRLVDLAPLSDPQLVPSALAAVLGVAVRSENPYPALTSFLKDRQMLLLFDNCEHVLLAAAALAEELLKGAPGIHVLATSREPLRAEDERVQRLPPLETAPTEPGLTVTEALSYPAVQLFVERAAATAGGYELKDEDIPIVAQICRRLDGIALAIELAASRVDAFGVRGVSSRLDDRFHLLSRGRRTALPRHQTLRAAFDWSYELLSETERFVMRRLGVFAGRFTMDAATAIAGDGTTTAHEIDDVIADLVEKSLVIADVGGAKVFYRLTETARAYALNRLTEEETQAVRRRHALYQLDRFERAHAEWDTWPTLEWLSAYAQQIDDLRNALDWAFSPNGDVGVGIELTVAASPLWFEMSLMEECRARAERALVTLGESTTKNDRRRMQLCAAVAWSQMYTTASVRDTEVAWTTAFEIAEALDDTDYRLRALWGMWASRVNRGEFGEALTIAKRFSSVADKTGDVNDRLLGDRLTGATLHFLGRQSSARQHIERMLASYVTPVRRSHAVRFQFDQRVTARITLARVPWLQGFANQALRCIQINVDEALSINHRLSLCNALVQAARPVALMAGDLMAAERYIKMLLDQTASDELDIWRAYGRCFEGELDVKRGAAAGLQQLKAGIDELRRARFVQYLTTFLGALAEGLAVAGDALLAKDTIDEAIVRSEQSAERWCSPELLRIRGVVVLQRDVSHAAGKAEEDFLESIELARTQEALAWELRTTTSLARLRRDQGRIGEAYELLAPIYSRFTEGYETNDLTVAKVLLDELSGQR